MIDVQDICVDGDARVEGLQAFGVSPVRRCPLAVQKACSSESKGARAHGHHSGSVGRCLTQSLTYLGGRIIQRRIAGHYDGVRELEGIQAISGLDGIPGCGRNQAGLGCADPEGVPFPFILVAENLRWNGKVKSDDIRQRQRDDSVHRATVLTTASSE
jgi:hypothetical protein